MLVQAELAVPAGLVELLVLPEIVARHQTLVLKARWVAAVDLAEQI
jgi:hypothetical protein